MTAGVYNWEELTDGQTVPSRTYTLSVQYPGATAVGQIRQTGKSGKLVKQLDLAFDGSVISQAAFDWTFGAGVFFYDIFLINAGRKSILLAGQIKVGAKVTTL